MNLLKPTGKIIELFNNVWNAKKCDNELKNLFQNGNEIDIVENIVAKSGNDDEKLSKIFKKYSDDDYDGVLLKVLLLDKLYSTQVKNPLHIAESICQICEKDKNTIRNGEAATTIVERLAGEKNKEKNTRREYSFATKYCNWSNPEKYYIYDEIVADMLYEYNTVFNFFGEKKIFKETDDNNKCSLKRYSDFCEVYEKFKDTFSLNGYSPKSIDVFLWTYGKVLKGSK